MMKRIGELKAENARLKAECQARQAENSVLAVECDSLKAEVERLTKAGDGLHAFLINYIVESRISSAYLNKLDDGWLNAKKGGQP
jgi:cell division protein FtsB